MWTGARDIEGNGSPRMGVGISDGFPQATKTDVAGVGHHPGLCAHLSRGGELGGVAVGVSRGGCHPFPICERHRQDCVEGSVRIRRAAAEVFLPFTIPARIGATVSEKFQGGRGGIRRVKQTADRR